MFQAQVPQVPVAVWLDGVEVAGLLEVGISCGLKMDFSFSSGSLWPLALQYTVLGSLVWLAWCGTRGHAAEPRSHMDVAGLPRTLFGQHCHVWNLVRRRCGFGAYSAWMWACLFLQSLPVLRPLAGSAWLLRRFIIQALGLMRALLVCALPWLHPAPHGERKEWASQG